jgi:hypothetical protein
MMISRLDNTGSDTWHIGSNSYNQYTIRRLAHLAGTPDYLLACADNEDTTIIFISIPMNSNPTLAPSSSSITSFYYTPTGPN